MRDETWADKVRAFMRAMDQATDQPWIQYSPLEELHALLIEEEFNEFLEADGEIETIKELVDLLYVSIGYAIAHGWDIETAFNRVHESNMSKLVNGVPLKRADGKVIKGPNYRKPVLDDLVGRCRPDPFEA